MFQLANEYPALTSAPVLPNAVTVEPVACGLARSTGTAPPVIVLPSYATAYLFVLHAQTGRTGKEWMSL